MRNHHALSPITNCRSPFGLYKRNLGCNPLIQWAAILSILLLLSVPVLGLPLAQQEDLWTPGNSSKIHAGSEASLPEKISFNAHIRPIMSNTCFVCHGPDEEANHSGLRLDSRTGAIEGGAIVPGDPQQSLLYQRLVDADQPMPPADFRHQLSEQDRAVIYRWILQGADYELHWAFTPIQRPAVPVIADSTRVVNPIDSFIQARLTTIGLPPSDPAEKRTLLRRLSLDLIGLPPTREELNAFLADDSPEAYEKQVDRLLHSVRYGERMASAWLDIVRFSDTVGFHGDQNQRVFAFRDYVIDSLNQNKPFDEFTREQLAGDLWERPTDQQRIATALNRLNMVTREGGAQPAEYIAKYTADRVRMIGTAWLGLTTGCAECHNHKYDPLTTRDFYALGAFFDDIQQWGVYHEYEYTPNPDLRNFSNDHPFPPELRSFTPSLMEQIEFLEEKMAAAVASELPASTASDPGFVHWIKSVAEMTAVHADGWQPVSVESAVSAKSQSQPEVQSDQSVLVKDSPTADDILTVTTRLESSTLIKTLRLEVLPDAANNGHVGRAAGGSFSLSFSASSPADSPLAISLTQVDRLNPNQYSSGFESRFLSGPWRSGPARWQLPVQEASLPHTAIFHLETPFRAEAGQELTFQIASADVGRFRISISPLTRFVSGQPAATELLKTAAGKFLDNKSLTPGESHQLLTAYYLATTPTASFSKTAQIYRDQIADCRSGYSMTTIAVQADPQKWLKTRILPRGNWQDESGEVLQPNTPEFLPRLVQSDRRLTRMDLAKWLTAPNNPLTARHYVNRTWKMFFGNGLSAQLEDLGNQGEWPSHPELLDWLASEFQSDWDMKRLVRLIVTSHTYRQRCATNSQLSEIDPYNRLLAVQSPRRLEAETVRDNALAISGLWDARFIGGPSIFPYQPADYYANLQFPDRRYVPSPFELQYRRGVYIHWQRTFLHPSLLNFDAPARDECAADRPLSNSPQQALSLLNDPQFVEASIAFAWRILSECSSNSFEEQLDHAFQLALARPVGAWEREGLERLFKDQIAHYSQSPHDIAALLQPYPKLKSKIDSAQNLEPHRLAAFSQICRVILNLHETITRF